MQADLSKKDEQFRKFSLNGPMWRVVLYVGFPLALYESLNQLFKILDTMMASHIGRIRGVRGRVSVPDQHDDLGGGNRACGGRQHQGEPGIWGRRFHAGKKACQHNVCHVRALGIAILLVLVPFTPEFLRLMNTPEEFIADGSTYFRLELFGMVITFFNNVYIAIERARGNSKRILILNTAVIVVKLGLTAWFVYGLDGGINMISCATIISQSFLLLARASIMTRREMRLASHCVPSP